MQCAGGCQPASASAYLTLLNVPAFPGIRQILSLMMTGMMMMASGAATTVVVAGTATLANSWLQSKTINWKIPVATLLLAAGTEALAHWSPPVAAGMAALILLGALTATVGGKSIIDEIGSNFSGTSTSTTGGKK